MHISSRRSTCMHCHRQTPAGRQHVCLRYRRLRCRLCLRVCASLLEYQRHRFEHALAGRAALRTRRRKIKTTIAAIEETATKAQLRRRCRYNIPRDVYCRITCPDLSCGKVFVNQYRCNEHYERVHGIQQYLCDKCAQRFRTRYMLRDHERSVHLSKTDDSAMFSCKHCSLKFHNRSACSRHQTAHNPFSRMHECPRCDYVAKQRSNLTRHLKSHLRQDQLEMSRSSPPRPSLVQNLDATFSCCNQMFDRFGYSRHLTTVHHSELAFKCEVCKKVFKSLVFATKHMTTKHLSKSNWQQYACGLCVSRPTFKHLRSLRNHFSKVHFPADGDGRPVQIQAVHILPPESPRSYQCVRIAPRETPCKQQQQPPPSTSSSSLLHSPSASAFFHPAQPEPPLFSPFKDLPPSILDFDLSESILAEYVWSNIGECEDGEMVLLSSHRLP